MTERLRLHEQTPLTLDDHRLIFTTDDLSNPIAAVAEIAEESQRRLDVAAAIVELLRERGPRMGPMTAHDFFGALIDRDDLPDATSSEIEVVLAALSSQLLGLLRMSEDGAVRFATFPNIGAFSLARLSQVIT